MPRAISQKNGDDDVELHYILQSNAGADPWDEAVADSGFNHRYLELDRSVVNSSSVSFSLIERIGVQLTNDGRNISYKCSGHMHDTAPCRHVLWITDQTVRASLPPDQTIAQVSLTTDEESPRSFTAKVHNTPSRYIRCHSVVDQNIVHFKRAIEERAYPETRLKIIMDRVSRQAGESLLQQTQENLLDQYKTMYNTGVLSVGIAGTPTADQAHDDLELCARDLYKAFEAHEQMLLQTRSRLRKHQEQANAVANIYLFMMRGVILPMSLLGQLGLRAVAAKLLSDEAELERGVSFWHQVHRFFHHLQYNPRRIGYTVPCVNEMIRLHSFIRSTQEHFDQAVLDLIEGWVRDSLQV